MKQTEQKRILKLIEEHRDIQHNRMNGRKYSVAEWLLILDDNVNELKKMWTNGDLENETLLMVLQVAVNAVAALEQNGVPGERPIE